jgi:hypothetical protein
MNIDRESVIRMAREAGFTIFDEPNRLTECQMLDHFATLVAAEAAKAKREACAKLAEVSLWSGHIIAKKIRERSNTQ